jgi:exosortase
VELGVENFLMAPNDRAPLVVVVLAAWLAWRRWPRVAALEAKAGSVWLTVLSLALGGLVFGWAIHTGAQDLQSLSLVFVASGLVLAAWGLPGLRALWLPIAFLLFCIPIPGPMLVSVLWSLRLWTAEYSGWLLYLMGIPALVSGDQILRATQAFQVIEGCSGLRSIETLAMLVILLIDLFHRRGWHAASLLLLSPFVAFALNGIRVLALILNPHSNIAAVHSLQGVLILMGGLLLIYFVDGGIDWLKRRFAHRAPEPTSTPTRPERSGARRVGSPALLLVATGAVALLASWTVPTWKRTSEPVADLAVLFDEALAGFTWKPLEPDPYFHGRLRYRRTLHREYQVSGGPVEVFVAIGDVRDRRTTSIGPLNALPGSGWAVRDAWQEAIGPDDLLAGALLIEKGTDRRVSYLWYEGKRSFGVETARGFLGLDRSLWGRTDPLVVVRLSARTPDLERRSTGRVERRQIEPVLQRISPALEVLASPRAP